MKAKTIMLFLVLMFSAFTGGALAGNETGLNTWYGENAGHAVPSAGHNAFFGESAGYSTTSGCCNAFIGRGAGITNTSGVNNVFVGNQAGWTNLTGTDNTFVGRASGYTNTASQNTYVGSYTGYNNTTGDQQVFIGYEAGRTNATAEGGTYVGYQAGKAATAAYNTFIGSMAGLVTTSGSGNTFVGRRSGQDNTEGAYNSALGYYAGESITTGDYNVFIGYQAGDTITTEDHNTGIGGYSDIAAGVTNATAIGYRAMVTQNDSLVLGSVNGVNGSSASVNVGIGTSAPVRQLHIVGDQAVFRMDRPVDTAAFMLVRTDASGTPLKTFVVGANASGSNTGEFVINDLGTAVSGPGTNRLRIANNGVVYVQSLVQTSSLALKDNVRTYANALETVKKLRGVSFNWKESGKPSVGLIAEEVEKVIPEVIAHDGQAATGVNYSSLVGVLVEAVKEQQAELDALKDLKRINDEQQKTISALSEKVSELECILIMSRAVSKAE
jgi:hypothetical protein